MRVMIISSSPCKNGLTQKCVEKAKQGAGTAGAETVEVRLNDLQIFGCLACGPRGWGVCREKHRCCREDDFQKLHSELGSMDAFIVITPVYWGDMSESAKHFFDRLRRCEASKQEGSFLQQKPVIVVAAAGGSGNGILSCLATMDRLFIQMKAHLFDCIGVKNKISSYKLVTIHNAVLEMVQQELKSE